MLDKLNTVAGNTCDDLINAGDIYLSSCLLFEECAEQQAKPNIDAILYPSAARSMARFVVLRLRHKKLPLYRNQS